MSQVIPVVQPPGQLITQLTQPLMDIFTVFFAFAIHMHMLTFIFKYIEEIVKAGVELIKVR